MNNIILATTNKIFIIYIYVYRYDYSICNLVLTTKD